MPFLGLLKRLGVVDGSTEPPPASNVRGSGSGDPSYYSGDNVHGAEYLPELSIGDDAERLHQRIKALLQRNAELEETVCGLEEDLETAKAATKHGVPQDVLRSRDAEDSEQRGEVASGSATIAVSNARIVELENDRKVLSGKVSSLEMALNQAQEGRAAALQDVQGARDKMAAMRESAAEAKNRLALSLRAARENLIKTSALWKEARKYFSIFRQGLLFDEIAKSQIDMSADVYLCLLPSSVPAGNTLSRLYGGRVICDCVENVEAERHSLAPRLQPAALEIVNLAAYGALTTVDGMMTVSNAVARTLDRFGPPVRVQPNYRRYEEAAPSGSLRTRFGIPENSTVVITTGNIVKGFEAIIDSLLFLPDDVHLIAFAKISPPEYDEVVRDHVNARGLSGRVHLHGFVPYEELAGLLSDADAGLIALDPDNPNHSVSLPNRVFDFTTATLPFVVPQLSEISEFVDEFGCGVTVRNVSPEAWAEGIKAVLRDRVSYRAAMEAARAKVTWESLDDGLFEFLGRPKTVTLLGFRDLSRYQRFIRITDSLTARGVHVKAAFFSESPMPIANKEAEFYHFTDRYGRGDGLVRVPVEVDGD